jgi:hypothetical protein
LKREVVAKAPRDKRVAAKERAKEATAKDTSDRLRAAKALAKAV